MSPKVQRMRDDVALHMNRILENFLPGSRITVLVRPSNGDVESEVLMTNDDLDEVARAIERSKQRELS